MCEFNEGVIFRWMLISLLLPPVHIVPLLVLIPVNVMGIRFGTQEYRLVS